MRLSREPGAGTSSFVPAPATDRNVSTSQQQPLPAPDPDAADGNLGTPTGTTAHLAGSPPGDPTSDRADEQPRSNKKCREREKYIWRLLLMTSGAKRILKENEIIWMRNMIEEELRSITEQKDKFEKQKALEEERKFSESQG
ncbi:hypothetical protein JCGZ_04539 [Jatropha curcas]|uniref:Uncharacterized protein n=1 Tax=Jatropha curcas TaxID=180498 RepID=A0A067LP01_JATCU|nr:hypothetical protein JCGZ_04539 [Jatropha curcas]